MTPITHYEYQIHPANPCLVEVRETYSDQPWRDYWHCATPDRALYVLKAVRQNEKRRVMQELAECTQ